MDSYFYLLMFGIGSIPFGVIWSNVFNKNDIRQHGSGNIGTSNAWRVNGKIVGTLTAICDVAKGASCLLFPGIALHLGMFAVLGHIYAPWSRGKGVAPFFGLCLAVFGFWALLPMLVWITLVSSKKVVPTNASYAALFVMLIISSFFSLEYFFVIFSLNLIIVKRHISAQLTQSNK